MKAQYQKYYDNLRGKDFASPASQYSSVLSSAGEQFNTTESIINSSNWIEKGLEVIKGSVLPSLKNQATQLESGISALSQVAGKVSELVGQVEALKNLEETLNSLGGKWTYTEGGKKTKSEVNSHNKQIDDTKEQIDKQEASIDATVAAINGISFSFSSSKLSFGSSMSNLQTIIEDYSKSGVLSYSVGTLSEPGREAKVLGKRATRLEIVCNGQVLGQDGSITIKKGQTVHLKVRIPDEIENVTTLKRTSADGTHKSESFPGWGAFVSQQNDPQVNKNDKSTYANTREYDWYITGKNTTENITLSQTALFSIPGAKLGSYKGMIRLRVKVVD